MAEINYTPEFKRNYKKLKRKHYNMQKLKHVIELLQHEDFQVLRNSYDDHFLHGKWEGNKALHVEKNRKGNWILIYRISKCKVQLVSIDLVATGNHEIYNLSLIHI